MEQLPKKLIYIAILSIFYFSSFRNRAINKITLELGFKIEEKEIVRKYLNELKSLGYLRTKLLFGINKWVLTSKGRAYLHNLRIQERNIPK